MNPKNLTVRLDEETREILAIIADREIRPLANQIVVFVKQGITNYIKENNLMIEADTDVDEKLKVTYALLDRPSK